MQWRKRVELRKNDDEEIDTHLTSFERKMSRGQANADQWRRETSSKASRVSFQQQETLRQYSSRCESEHTRTLEKVL